MIIFKKKFAEILSVVFALILPFGLTGCASTVVKSSPNALPLNYAETGNPKGVAVILIHAFPMNQSMWNDQVEALSKEARVITFDIRGLGKNELQAPYTLEFIVDDLIALLDQLKIEKAVVCGLSMGGFVALRAIERNPNRFMGLVLANTKSGADSDQSKLGRYQALKTLQEKGLNTFAENFAKQATSPATQADKPQVFSRVKQIMQSNSVTGVQAAVLALTSRTDTTAHLSNIQVPTLILHGEFDTVIPLTEAKSLHDKIKSSKLFVVPRAGHLSNLENPSAFNEQLLNFISKF